MNHKYCDGKLIQEYQNIITDWAQSVIERLQKEGHLEELLKEVNNDQRRNKRISEKMA